MKEGSFLEATHSFWDNQLFSESIKNEDAYWKESLSKKPLQKQGKVASKNGKHPIASLPELDLKHFFCCPSTQEVRCGQFRFWGGGGGDTSAPWFPGNFPRNTQCHMCEFAGE